MISKVWSEIIYAFPNFNGFTIAVSERMSYFIPYNAMDVITYLMQDSS